MAELKSIIEQSMIQYSGAVIQSRALVDVRDGLKPSARQILYTMYKYGYNSNKPYHKTAAVVGDTLKHYYIHGDSSAEGIIMRLSQPFSLRYPFVDVKGNSGTQIESGNWGAPRYTEAKLSKLGDAIFADVNKDTVKEWKDNYANDEQYPSILPSKGFYGICNGTIGIAIGMASSIPQYNLRELNNALIHLLNNPDCNFDDIFCVPDFSTGGILLNVDEVKESHRNGGGASCKLRSVIEFDTTERCFIVTEIPYSVYTNTICGELEEIINGENNPGIERFNDLTGKTPLIKIYLTKKANPDKVLKTLYKETSLQSYYSINFTALDNGRFPRVFTWKEMLQAHLDHEKEVYTRGFQFDLKKINSRLHIINGLLVCMASIEEVIKTIKSSSSTAAASIALQKNFLLDEVQAKAVLDMKLSRLAHLEVEKLEKEKSELEGEKEKIEAILNDERLLKKEIENGLKEVAEKFGDGRRTRVLNLTSISENEVVEEKFISLSLTNYNNLYAYEYSTLMTQNRGGVGNRIKLAKGEYIVDTASVSSRDTVLMFSTDGRYFTQTIHDFPFEETVGLSTILNLANGEKICKIASLSSSNQFICFVTKKGYVKKSLLSNYRAGKSGGVKAINLEANDKVVSIFTLDDEPIGILAKNNHFILIDSKEINPIGRLTRGVIGIKVKNDDEVVKAAAMPTGASEIISISSDGVCSRTKLSEFSQQKRGGTGIQLQGTNSKDGLVDFLFLTKSEKSIIINTSLTAIKVDPKTIPLTKRGAIGVNTVKLSKNSKITGIFSEKS